jgi:hypothetical protein
VRLARFWRTSQTISTSLPEVIVPRSVRDPLDQSTLRVVVVDGGAVALVDSVAVLLVDEAAVVVVVVREDVLETAAVDTDVEGIPLLDMVVDEEMIEKYPASP